MLTEIVVSIGYDARPRILDAGYNSSHGHGNAVGVRRILHSVKKPMEKGLANAQTISVDWMGAFMLDTDVVRCDSALYCFYARSCDFLQADPRPMDAAFPDFAALDMSNGRAQSTNEPVLCYIDEYAEAGFAQGERQGRASVSMNMDTLPVVVDHRAGGDSMLLE